MTGIVHSGEEHVLGIDIIGLVADDEVGVLLVFRGFLLALIDGGTIVDAWLAEFTVAVEQNL